MNASKLPRNLIGNHQGIRGLGMNHVAICSHANVVTIQCFLHKHNCWWQHQHVTGQKATASEDVNNIWNFTHFFKSTEAVLLQISGNWEVPSPSDLKIYI